MKCQIRRKLSGIALLVLVVINTGCKKAVEVQPPATSITQTNVFSTDATAIAVMTGLYAKMAYNSMFSGNASISAYCGLSADEISLWNGSSNTTLQAYYKNSLVFSAGNNSYFGSDFWSPCYQNIFICNSVIDGLNSTSANSLTPGIRQQLLGEAKFMRAFHYFYLVNLFGDVPLALTSDYNSNLLLARTSRDSIYKWILIDIKDAQSLLSSTFLNGTLNGVYPERVRPTSWAATALLARVYLYMADYTDAETQATILINNSAVFGLNTLNNAFLRAGLGNNEVIWQLQSVGISSTLLNTWDGYYFVIPTTGPNGAQCFSINNNLLNSFEVGDNRKGNWIGVYGTGVNAVYYPAKYKLGSQSSGSVSNEYVMVLRLAEQYLIRAEARAQQGNITGATGAIADLNIIRNRAFSTNGNYAGATDKTSILSAIMHERQVELFSEWGHRWLDLKRTGTVDAVMGGPTGACAAKGGSWNTIQQLYPISYADILLDNNLVQNPGY